MAAPIKNEQTEFALEDTPKPSVSDYVIAFIDENGNPDSRTSFIYQVNNVSDEQLEAVMHRLTTVTEALTILQPDRKTGVFRLERLD